VITVGGHQLPRRIGVADARKRSLLPGAVALGRPVAEMSVASVTGCSANGRRRQIGY